MSDAELIDQIQQIRVANNRPWMDLVRLALEVAPQRTRAILREIAQHDGDVRRLTLLLSEMPPDEVSR